MFSGKVHSASVGRKVHEEVVIKQAILTLEMFPGISANHSTSMSDYYIASKLNSKKHV